MDDVVIIMVATFTSQKILASILGGVTLEVKVNFF